MLRASHESIGTPLLHRIERRKRLNCLALTYVSQESPKEG